MATDGKIGSSLGIVKDMLPSPKTFVTGFRKSGDESDPTSPVSRTVSTTPAIGKEGIVTEIPSLPCTRARRLKDLGMNQVALSEGMAALRNCIRYVRGKTPLSSPGASPTSVTSPYDFDRPLTTASDAGLLDAQLPCGAGRDRRRLPYEEASSIQHLGENQEGLMQGLEQLRDSCSAILDSKLDESKVHLPCGKASSRDELAANQRALYGAIAALRQAFEQIGSPVGLPLPPFPNSKCRSMHELSENQLALRKALIVLQMAVDRDSALASMYNDHLQDDEIGSAWLCGFW